MNVPKIIIAIDGYASTGKSSFAKMIAAKYGFLYLDSGAIYRAVTKSDLDNFSNNLLSEVKKMIGGNSNGKLDDKKQ